MPTCRQPDKQGFINRRCDSRIGQSVGNRVSFSAHVQFQGCKKTQDFSPYFLTNSINVLEL